MKSQQSTERKQSIHVDEEVKNELDRTDGKPLSKQDDPND
jgi:hypothetical protein